MSGNLVETTKVSTKDGVKKAITTDSNNTLIGEVVTKTEADGTTSVESFDKDKKLIDTV